MLSYLRSSHYQFEIDLSIGVCSPGLTPMALFASTIS